MDFVLFPRACLVSRQHIRRANRSHYIGYVSRGHYIARATALSDSQYAHPRQK